MHYHHHTRHGATPHVHDDGKHELSAEFQTRANHVRLFTIVIKENLWLGIGINI